MICLVDVVISSVKYTVPKIPSPPQSSWLGSYWAAQGGGRGQLLRRVPLLSKRPGPNRRPAKIKPFFFIHRQGCGQGEENKKPTKKKKNKPMTHRPLFTKLRRPPCGPSVGVRRHARCLERRSFVEEKAGAGYLPFRNRPRGAKKMG